MPSDAVTAADERGPELEDAIEQLHGLNCGAHRQLLHLVAEYYATETWKDDGVATVADWLAVRLSISLNTAREWVNVALALEELPAIANTYFEGRISWDQVRHLVKMATPETDAAFAEDATGLNAAQIEAAARRTRRISDAEDHDAERHRSLRWWWTHDKTWFHFKGMLPAADGALVAHALERIAERAPRDPQAERVVPFESRAADALAHLASQDLDADFDAARATLVVHVDAAALSGGDGVAEIQGEGVLSIPTALRLGCDSEKETVVEGSNGVPVGIGRKSRQVPHWLKRQLHRRDQGCRFPSCGRGRWVEAHHIVHWAEGGSTDRENLILLCSFHHRLLHKKGWKIDGHPDDRLTFVRPDGEVLKTGPPPLRPDFRKRLLPI